MVLLSLHSHGAAALSNLRPLRGALQKLGGPDMLFRKVVAENLEVLGNIVGHADGLRLPAVFDRRQEHVPVPQDYESALRAGLRMAQELLQEEAETGEATRVRE